MEEIKPNKIKKCYCANPHYTNDFSVDYCIFRRGYQQYMMQNHLSSEHTLCGFWQCLLIMPKITRIHRLIASAN